MARNAKPRMSIAGNTTLANGGDAPAMDNLVLKRRRLRLEPFDQPGAQNLTFYCSALFLTLMALLVGSIYLYRSATQQQSEGSTPMKSLDASVWCLFPRSGAYSAADVPMQLCSVLVYDGVMVHSDLSIRAMDDRELVTRLPALRKLRQSNNGLSVHVRLSGRGGAGSRVLASIVHTGGDLHRLLLLQIIAFLELQRFDGLMLDLGDAVAMHRIFTDQAVLNVRNFVQVCHEFLLQYKLQFSLLVPADPVLSSYYDVPEYLAIFPHLFVIQATHQLHSHHHRSCPAPVVFTGKKRPKDLEDVASLVWSTAVRVTQTSRLNRLAFSASPLGAVYVGDNEPAPSAETFSPAVFLKYSPFSEICHKLATEQGWTQRRDGPTDCLVIWKGSVWLSVPTADSFSWVGNTTLPVRHVAVFNMEADDYRNVCGGGKHPLVGRIHRLLDRRGAAVGAGT